MINNSVLKALLFALTPEGFFGLPLLLWGEPGVGKTGLVRAIAKAFGLPFLRLSPAERGEGYFGVVPVPGADGHLHYPAPHDAVTAFGDGRGMLFVDEINLASPHLQAPLLGLVQLKTLGNHTFPNGVRVIGAANEVRDAAGGFDLAAATANRFAHYDYTGLEADDWAAALVSGFRMAGTFEPAHVIEERVREAWPQAIAEAAGMVSAFITRRPNLLHKRLPKGSPERAWPSRRTVEYVTCAIASAKIHGLTESDTDYMLGGFVGQAWVAEFRQFSELNDLPNTLDVLDEKVKFQHDERRPDRTLAVLSACAAYVVPAEAQKRKERGAALWRLIGEVFEKAPDFVVMPARQVSQAGILFTTAGSASTRTLANMVPFLKRAGVMS